MSVSRPLGRLLTGTTHWGLGVRCFSNTPIAQFPRRRPSPKDMLSVAAAAPKDLSPQTAPYTQPQLEELQQHFTPRQLSALMVGEQAISRSDFEGRVPRRAGDPLALDYIDDLAVRDPVLDLPDRRPKPSSKVKYDSKGWVVPEQNIPVVEDSKYKYSEDDQEGDMYRNLAMHTGLSESELKSVRSKLLVSHSVTNQTRMGKIRRIYALAVAGNGNGLLGIGEGKASEAEDAIRQATYMAIRNMEPVPRYESRTTFGDVQVKNGAVEMTVFTRPPGFGVRCSQYIFEMCRCAGIQDLSARVTRSRNPMNVVKTFMMALKSQKLPETIARGRGKKFIDVRRVYYGGKT
ncbi:ribosomal protein S5, C-terminal domain-containing protein [Geopyxis carbonaria]|nr:ribosomal protein S5, C-terminal domain-containing protein [Geopyxis carbonaria]